MSRLTMHDHMNQVSRTLGRPINVHESQELTDGYRLKITFGAGSIMHTPYVVTSFDNGQVEHPPLTSGGGTLGSTGRIRGATQHRSGFGAQGAHHSAGGQMPSSNRSGPPSPGVFMLAVWGVTIVVGALVGQPTWLYIIGGLIGLTPVAYSLIAAIRK